jgi:hypothetical protein
MVYKLSYFRHSHPQLFGKPLALTKASRNEKLSQFPCERNIKEAKAK